MRAILAIGALLLSADGPPKPTVVVVVGVAGTPEYALEFQRWADLWRAAASKAGADFARIGLDPEGGTSDRDRLRDALAKQAGEADGRGPLWLVLIGHGSFDGREAKFNLRGPDATDVDLAAWLAPIKRPLAVLDCSSASGSALSRFSGEGRVVVTATKSGAENNYARFGRYLAESIGEVRSDLDKDGQVSLLEAYLTAARQTDEFYKSKSRLATEHALLDDNGDKLGTPADWFRGVRAVKKAKDGATADGVRAHQFCLLPNDRERAMPGPLRDRRDRLERDLASLRDRKGKLAEDDYYRQLEALLLDLARIYAEGQPKSAGGTQ